MTRLDRGELERLKTTERVVEKKFSFGDTTYTSKRELELPVWISRKKVYIRTYVVDGEVPWLIGRTTMQNLRMKLDLEREEVEIVDIKETVKLRVDNSGHLRIKLGRKMNSDEVWTENLLGDSRQERRNKLRKLHLQFGHPGQEKLTSLLEEAWKTGKYGTGCDQLVVLKEEIKQISEECEICQKFRKTPPRPVVGLPWSCKFNEVVALDLGEYDGKKFLVMVDMGTRYCQACWVRNKKPEEIIKAFIKHWVALFGCPRVVLSDNGGEFNNESFLRMTEMLGVKCKTTAAESPFSNGMCEKMVGLLKDAVRKMESECEGGLEMLLYWAVSAKNCLHNQRGFSPNQLVFGRNPGLPNLQGETSISGLRDSGDEEQVMRENLEAMHHGRRVHVIQESDERVRRALRSRIREHRIEDAEMSDEVFYKRDGESEWRGPARVIGRDGKSVVVKHGGAIREVARVHITRISGKKALVSEGTRKNAGGANGTAEKETDESSDSESESDTDVETVELQMNGGDEGDTDVEAVERQMSGDEEGETGEEETLENQESVTVTQEEEVNNTEDEATDPREEEAERAENGIERPRRSRGRKAKVTGGLQKFKRGDNILAKESRTGEEKEFSVLGRAGKKSSKKWTDSYNVEDKVTGEKLWVNLKEYENIRKRTEGEEMLFVGGAEEIEEAKRKEFLSWRENEVYEEVQDTGQKSVSVRWVITSKEKEGKKICKARLVARGFEERDEGMEKDAPTCASETFRLCLAIVLHKGWEAKTIDVKTAYLQGDRIERDVYVKPPAEAKCKGLWKLKKTIYGLKDAARAWYARVCGVVKELGGERSSLEPTLFIWKDKTGNLKGVMCTHVDDFCFGGSKDFEVTVIGKLKEILKVGEIQEKSFSYIGVNVEQRESEIFVDQEKYTESFKVPAVDQYKGMGKLGTEDMKVYRGIVGKMNWVAQHSRPDVSFNVSLSGRHFQTASGTNMVDLIKMVKGLKRKGGKLKFQKLSRGMAWEVFSDASLGNIDECFSQIGFIISLKDENGNRCPVYWKSVRARRVVRSATEAEAIALNEAAEMTMYLNELWREITGGEGLKITITTDSKTLESGLKSSTGVKSRRLRIELAGIREMIDNEEIYVNWVFDKEQVADALTKEEGRKGLLRDYVFGEGKTRKWWARVMTRSV